MEVPWLRSFYLWITLSTFYTDILAASKQNIYSSGCSKERINLVCPENHKIAIKRLFYGIKNDARCSGQGRYHSVDCCQPTHTDCLVVDDRKYPVLNMLCSGQRGCDVPATSIQSGQACYSKGYGNMTDYMSVIHDCIPDDDIIPLCSNTHKRGKHLYLANAKYPLPLDAGNDHCQCLIETGSQVGIDIHALDVIITRTESGNHCYQDIELRDDEGHRKEITCGHPGLYAFRNIYNNDVRSVTFTLNNRAPKAQGYIWIQAEAKGDNDFIEIYCGDEMLKRLGYVNPRHTESRTIDNEESGPTLKPVENGGSTNSSNSGTPNVMSDLMELFIGIGVAVVFIIIIGLTGIIILCVRRSDSKKRPTVQHPPPFPSPIMKNKDNNHSSNTYCHYDYDEDKYCSIKRSPMKMTKYSDMNRNADKKLKEAFSQGMSQNDPSQQNGYVNYLEHVQHLDASQQEPLLKKTETDDSDEVSEDEIIMPQSEFITIGKAIQPRITNEREIVAPTLPQKKKMKNKTVTFSPVAMVTPLPSGSEESVPEDYFDEPKANYLEMYSKTMPNRSPEKVKKIMKVTGSQDDMCLNNIRDSDCENVTEEDLWKAFHIKLSDNMSSDPELNPKKGIELKEMQEDPDYDENPYDNLPYINVGSLRRHNIPENNTKDIYREVLKRNYSHEPTMECIPEQ